MQSNNKLPHEAGVCYYLDMKEGYNQESTSKSLYEKIEVCKQWGIQYEGVSKHISDFLLYLEAEQPLCRQSSAWHLLGGSTESQQLTANFEADLNENQQVEVKEIEKVIDEFIEQLKQQINEGVFDQVPPSEDIDPDALLIKIDRIKNDPNTAKFLLKRIERDFGEQDIDLDSLPAIRKLKDLPDGDYQLSKVDPKIVSAIHLLISNFIDTLPKK